MPCGSCSFVTGLEFFTRQGKLDPSAEKTLSAGGFAATPAEAGHWLSFDDDTVIQVTGVGPWNITYLDPRDDPRAAQR